MHEGTLRYLSPGTPSARYEKLSPQEEGNARLVACRPCKDLSNLPCKQARRAKRDAREGGPARAHTISSLHPALPTRSHSPEINPNTQFPLVRLDPFPH